MDWDYERLNDLGTGGMWFMFLWIFHAIGWTDSIRYEERDSFYDKERD